MVVQQQQSEERNLRKRGFFLKLSGEDAKHATSLLPATWPAAAHTSRRSSKR
jgi:hypothetical protein